MEENLKSSESLYRLHHLYPNFYFKIINYMISLLQTHLWVDASSSPTPLLEGSLSFFSFSQTYLRNFWRCSYIEHWPWGPTTLGNLHANVMKCTMRASRHANPQRTKRPWKLLSWSWSTSVVMPCTVHALFISHLSWIL